MSDSAQINSSTDASTGAVSASGKKEVKLPGLFAFKEGMSTIYSATGEAIPVTVLRYDPWIVTQLKTEPKEGYSSVQLACLPKKKKNSTQAQRKHLGKAGFENGARFVKELRTEAPGDAAVGDQLSIDSLIAGDKVKLTGTSKGHGFVGSVKRWNFAGGPASHGSKFHRQPGSVGNRTWPGRVMPGKKFPGHYGDETISVKNVEIVEVNRAENVLFVKGPVPGSRNSLVKLMKD